MSGDAGGSSKSPALGIDLSHDLSNVRTKNARFLKEGFQKVFDNCDRRRECFAGRGLSSNSCSGPQVLHVMYVSALIYARSLVALGKVSHPLVALGVALSVAIVALLDFILVGLCLLASWSDDEVGAWQWLCSCQLCHHPYW